MAHGGGTSRNSAAHLKPAGKRPVEAGPCVLRGKWALLLAPFSFVSFSFGAQKKMKTGLRTTKSRLFCSFQGWHYPKHPKNIAQLAKIKRPTIKGNFQEHPIFSALSSKSAVSNKQSATPYFAHCPLPIADLSRTPQR